MKYNTYYGYLYSSYTVKTINITSFAPYNFTATFMGENSYYANILLGWEMQPDVSDEIDAFEIAIYKNGLNLENYTRDSSCRYFSAFLSEEGSYEFKIRSVKYINNKNVYSAYVTRYLAVAPLTPHAPTLFYVNMSGRNATRTWNYSYTANSFEIVVEKDGEVIRTENISSSLRTYIFNNLQPGEYVFKIRSVKIANNNKIYSGYLTRSMTVLGSPASPYDFTASILLNNAYLRWSVPNGTNSQLDSFELVIKKDDIIIKTLTTKSTMLTLDNITGTNYTFEVRSVLLIDNNKQYSDYVIAELVSMQSGQEYYVYYDQPAIIVTPEGFTKVLVRTNGGDCGMAYINDESIIYDEYYFVQSGDIVYLEVPPQTEGWFTVTFFQY